MPSINLSSGVLDKPHLIVLLTRQMPNKVIVTRLSWEMMKIHQAKTKFKTEWKGSYPVKRTLGDPFSFYVFPKPVDKPPGFLTLISFGVERFARGPLFKWSPVNTLYYIKWPNGSLCLKTLFPFLLQSEPVFREHQLRSRGYPQITGFTVDGDGKMSGEGLP